MQQNRARQLGCQLIASVKRRANLLLLLSYSQKEYKPSSSYSYSSTSLCKKINIMCKTLFFSSSVE